MRTAIFAAALFGTPATGQTVAEVLSQIDGKEVVESGALHISPSGANFIAGDVSYSARFALDRAQVELLDPCTRQLGEQVKLCDAEVRAEIETQSGQISLLIFDLISVEPTVP